MRATRNHAMKFARPQRDVLRGEVEPPKRTSVVSAGGKYDAATVGRPCGMHIVAFRLFDAPRPWPSTSISRIWKPILSSSAEVARRRPSGLQNGCCQLPVLVSARPSAPFVAARRNWKRSVPSSAENASVVPSGDHHGWRLSPGRLVTCCRSEPSGETVQILRRLPPWRENRLSGRATTSSGQNSRPPGRKSA